jgi:hypothetical protein
MSASYNIIHHRLGQAANLIFTDGLGVSIQESAAER